MLATELAPHLQKKHTNDLLPVLINLMMNEQNQKMRTQATSVVLNVVQGMVNEAENEEDDVDGREILKPFVADLLRALVELLKHSIQSKYEPLQSEVLNVLHSVCSVILADFGVYFNDFMPMMKEILSNVGNITMSDKKLRAKAIDTIGSIIIAVSDCDDKAQFAPGVHEITQVLANALQQGLRDDDPQDEAIKNTLTQSAGFLQKDFAPYMQFLTQ